MLKIEDTDYRPRVTQKLKEYSKKAAVKGFRPGNVPPALIQKMYGRSILIDEINTLVAESLLKYLKDNKIDTLGEPLPVVDKMTSIDWEHQRDFEFEYEIGMVAPFTCALSKDMQVTHYQINDVAPQKVEEWTEKLREEYGILEEVQASEAQDSIYGVLSYSTENTERLEAWTEIAIDKTTEATRSAFLGVSPEDKVVLDIKYLLDENIWRMSPPEEMRTAMHNQGGEAELTVKKIYRRTPAVMDQAFFDKALKEGVVHDVSTFKEKVKEELIEHHQQYADGALERAIQKTLLNQVTIALPDEFLKKWLQEKAKTWSKEAIEKEYRAYAEKLRWNLLTEKISKDHDIEVSHEEVTEEMKQRIEALLSKNPGKEQLSEETKTQLVQKFLYEKEHENYRKIRERLYERKFIDLIKSQITIVPQEVSAEEFDRIVREQLFGD